MSKKLLVVDDDKYFTDDLKILLELDGYNVTVINNSEDLFSEIESMHKWDYLILDLMFRAGSFGDDSNLEAGEIFYNKMREKSSIPTVIISAKNRNEVNIDLSDRNTSFLRKPLSNDLNELQRIIGR